VFLLFPISKKEAKARADTEKGFHHRCCKKCSAGKLYNNMAITGLQLSFFVRHKELLNETIAKKYEKALQGGVKKMLFFK